MHSHSTPARGTSDVSVLLVDDEPDSRGAFRAFFERRYRVHTAGDGLEALEVLKGEPGINVVVTDVRMPRMNGLDLVREGREIDPDLGFIVVSGGGDADAVISALRHGARNYFMKPYRFDELNEAIVREASRYRLIQTERELRQTERAGEELLVGIDRIRYSLTSNMEWVPPFAFKLVRYMEAVGICTEDNRFNVGLGLIELLTNAIEHGSLGITGEEKVRLKMEGDHLYRAEIERRRGMEPYRDRLVTVSASINADMAMVQICDQGDGFDAGSLPDPTDPEHLFLPSGRGILLARAFLDEVTYNETGNMVKVVKFREAPNGT